MNNCVECNTHLHSLILWSSGPLVLWSSGPLFLWSSGPLLLAIVDKTITPCNRASLHHPSAVSMVDQARLTLQESAQNSLI